MNIKFNIKGVIYGVILLFMIIGGFILIPNIFMEKTKPIDYTILQREAIPEKILDMMDKYVNQERALAVKLDNKMYVIVTRVNDNKKGIEVDKIELFQEEEKSVMRVNATYKQKDKSYPYVVLETNLTNLPDRIELNVDKNQ